MPKTLEDPVLDHYNTHREKGGLLISAHGRKTSAPIKNPKLFHFILPGWGSVQKIDVVGSFTKKGLRKVTHRKLARYEVSLAAEDRIGLERQKALWEQASDVVGAQVVMELVNGWQARGTIGWMTNRYCSIKLGSGDSWAFIYTHSIVEWRVLTSQSENPKGDSHLQRWLLAKEQLLKEVEDEPRRFAEFRAKQKELAWLRKQAAKAREAEALTQLETESPEAQIEAGDTNSHI